MAASPTKNFPNLHPPTSTNTVQLASPRSTRTLRKLQSAHALSTSYAALNTPSLISQQRQQQQRNTSASNNTILSQLPPIPSFQPPHNRTRSNSDVILNDISNNGPPRRTAIMKKPAASELSKKDELEILIRQGPKGDVSGSLDILRRLVLDDGLHSDSDGMSQLRIYIWLILLNASPIATDTYLELVHRGPSPAYAKIRNDTFRTLATDPLFKRRVSESSLIRLLNAIAWRLHDAKNEQLLDPGKTTIITSELGSPALQHVSPVRNYPQSPLTGATDNSEVGGAEAGIYVQGMNVLCAPFLYAARSEAEAFVAFHSFITRECPGYVRGAMDGVHKGLALVDKCLAIVDSKLSDYMLSKKMQAEVYAFPSVLTLCACTPPLPQVLELWDFLFSYGAHLNILCICAQLVLSRDTIFASSSPIKILRSFPPLQAKAVRSYALSFVPKIPPRLYEELVHHAK